jgi:aspartyl-tRNA(Asn)/glutamyl-tRNA(Gln) amidotransferase subunit A
VPKEYFAAGLTASRTEQCVNPPAPNLSNLGAQCPRGQPAAHPLAVPAYYVIAPAECSANLARYDGVRYGHRCADPKDLEDLYTRSRAEGFGAEVKRRILVGTYALSAGYYDAYYLKAQQIRRLISDDFAPAFDAGRRDRWARRRRHRPSNSVRRARDPITMYLEDIYTIAANLAGLPALSIPAGLGRWACRSACS